MYCISHSAVQPLNYSSCTYQKTIVLVYKLVSYKQITCTKHNIGNLLRKLDNQLILFEVDRTPLLEVVL